MHIARVFNTQSSDLAPFSRATSGSNLADKPTLRLGMLGFSDSQRAHVRRAIELVLHDALQWKLGDFEQADARVVCGANTRLDRCTQNMAEASLQVLAASKGEKSMMLSLRSMSRPIAFSLPLHDPNIEPGLTCDVSSPASIHLLLTQFEKCLSTRLAQFTLGKHLTQREPELKATAYHILHASKLIAVVDLLSFQIGLLPDADPQEFENAVWKKRPVEAADIPHHFFPTNVVKVRWIYAQHTRRDLLPGRYRHKYIYFRQPPKISASWLTDAQLKILHKLIERPLNLLQLVHHLGVRHEDAARDLACLYFAAGVTTTASKAANALPKQEKRSVWAVLS